HEVENLEKRILDNEVKSKEREEDLKNQISEIELKSRKTEDEISVREDNLQKQVNSLKSELEKKNHDNSMCLNDIRILKSELGRITDEKNHFKLEIMQEKVNEHEDLLRLLSTQAKEKVLKEQHMEAIKQLSVNIQNLTNYHDDLTEIMSRKRCSNCCSKCLC
ncbi:hypothetical protein A2U01_0007388, partial [Trifolium medium]|nr:hypothetical protein [Trifolium medium]